MTTPPTDPWAAADPAPRDGAGGPGADHRAGALPPSRTHVTPFPAQPRDPVTAATRPTASVGAIPARGPANPAFAAAGPAVSPVPGHDGAPVAGYTFAVADDPQAWAPGSDAGLLDLSVPERLAAVARMAVDGRRVVVVCRSPQQAAIRATAAQARAMYDAHLAVLPIDVGPAAQIAATVVGQLVVSSQLRRPLAEVVVRLGSWAAQFADVAVVSSVSRLEHPGIGIGDQLRSYLPGRRTFAVQSSPSPVVVPLNRRGRPTGRRRLQGPGFDVGFGVRALVLGEEPVPDSVFEAMGVAGPATRLVAGVDPARYWRDPRATELVLVPEDVVGWVASLLPVAETWPCRWCGEALAAPVRSCPFCAHTLG
jgi:hypothetical protein